LPSRTGCALANLKSLVESMTASLRCNNPWRIRSIGASKL
jgi:hypothetical protein